MNFLDGQSLLFDKPKSWTSFDVVKKVRNTIRIKKVGHAGTLDPLATGLLVICTGKHTKRINEYQDWEKEYEVVFKLGATTASYDAEMPEENLQPADHISKDMVEETIGSFMGEVVQVPPKYSAVKIKGKRAYELARKGKDFKLKERTIQIYEAKLLGMPSADEISAKIVCSKGTYIRTLVHDWGQALGVGAYIRELRRTRIGSFKVEDAWDISDFADKYKVDPEKK